MLTITVSTYFVLTVKQRKLSWFGHVSRHDMLLKIILQEQRMVCIAEEDYVNDEETSSNGQANQCHYCSVSLMTEVDGQSLQRMHLSEYPTTPECHGH